MNVLSLFDGMSCGQIALERAGFKVDKYFAAEIDKYAMQVTQANYPDTIQIGDACQVKAKDLPKIDIILAGSPCQGFSLAGKQLNFSDERSALFFEFVRILKEVRKINPDVFFLLENVKMKREYQDIISDYMGCNPIVINSALLSAQNRVRLYWTNIPVIGEPKDKGILLKDILEDEVDEKYFLKNPKFDFGGMDIEGKGRTLRTGGCTSQSEKHNYDLIKIDKKGACLNGEAGGLGAKTGLYAVALRNRGEGKKPEIKIGDKANCLTSVQSDSMIITHNLQPRNGKGKGGKGHLSKTDQKSYCVDTGNVQAIERDYKIRRLTPVECERLQTVPDNYTSCVSNSQRYKMLGNGMTVDVIAWIFQFMDEERREEIRLSQKQTTLTDLTGG